MRVVMAVILAVAAMVPAAAQEIPDFPRWMAGAWSQESTDGGWADEYWTPPRGDIMIGAARIGRGSRLAIFEHTRIVRKDGVTLAFIAQPRGGPAAEFPLVTHDGLMIEFANPAHDYPQRIRYWREDGRLKARVSLMDGSKAQDWDYGPMDGEK